jgi:hypothetical protein
MDQALEALALHANATKIAFAILTKCLLNNGALRPGQFSAALKSTFNEPEADFQRLDYVFLQRLTKVIEDAENDTRPTSP